MRATPLVRAGVLLAVSLVAVVAAVLVLQRPAEVGAPGPEVAEVLRERDFGWWRYRATMADDRVRAVVDYDAGSAAAVERYVAANRSELPAIAESSDPAQVHVTFRRLLERDEFARWLAEKEIDVQATGVSLSAGDQIDLRMLPAGPQDPLPQVALDQAGGSLAGIFSVMGTAAPGNLLQLADDPAVFLVDVTPVLVRRDIAAANVVKQEQVDVEVPSPFPAMQRLGMVSPATPAP